MTNNEQKTINELYNSIHEFKTDVRNQITAINNKVEEKHLPITLESDILRALQCSMDESIKAVLSGYNSPLQKLILEVINKYSAELKSIISDSFSQVIRTDEFKQSIVSAFAHKVARTIISNNDGLFDKVSNELKQDAVFKSKMALAVAQVIEECLKEKK